MPNDALAEDDFVDLVPGPKAQKHLPPILIRTMRLGRHGKPMIQLSLSEEVATRLDGWPRFQIGYSAKRCTLRIRAAADAPFEAMRTRLGNRILLRMPLPPDLVQSDSREPGPFTWADGADRPTLYVTVPPAFRKPVDAVASARAAAPAPKFR